jgi:hypothetical protein
VSPAAVVCTDCQRDGAPTLVPIGEAENGRCPTHALLRRRRDDARRNSKPKRRQWRGSSSQKKRRWVLARDGYRCRICSGPWCRGRATTVHHGDSEDVREWLSACLPCHGREDGAGVR